MNVAYIKILHKEDAITGINGRCISETNPPAHKVGDVDEIAKVNEYYCCDEMEKQVKAGIIGFGSRPEDTYHNRLAEVFIWHATREDVPIAYCPWCQKPVTTQEVAVV